MSERPIGQVDATKVPRYAGLTTFARLPRREDVPSYDVAVLGVPFDSGVTYRPGARFGPGAVREASRLLKPYNPAQDASPFALAQVVDAGDVAANPFSLPEAMDQIQAGVADVAADGRGVVLLGGDHTIALPSLRALRAIHGPLALVHFDAHLDTWDTYFGAPCTHGTPFRRASEEGLLVKDRSAHVGIRGSLYDRSDLLDDADLGFTVVHARDVDDLGVRGVVERVRERVGDHPVYLSVDVDVLDPAFAPGTGTPEAGGLTSRELLAMLRGLAGSPARSGAAGSASASASSGSARSSGSRGSSGLDIVGGDVVEVAPAYDHAEVTAVAAATVAYEMVTALALRAAARRGETS